MIFILLCKLKTFKTMLVYAVGNIIFLIKISSLVMCRPFKNCIQTKEGGEGGYMYGRTVNKDVGSR
jgi:hypothetical protein